MDIIMGLFLLKMWGMLDRVVICIFCIILEYSILTEKRQQTGGIRLKRKVKRI